MRFYSAYRVFNLLFLLWLFCCSELHSEGRAGDSTEISDLLIDSLSGHKLHTSNNLTIPSPDFSSLGEFEIEGADNISKTNYEADDEFRRQRLLIDDEIEKAKKLIAAVEEAGNYVENLTADAVFMLPVGISKTMGNVGYTLAFHSSTFHSDYVELEVYLELKLPEETVYFAGRKIRFSKEGGLSKNARVELIGDFPITEGGSMEVFLKGGVFNEDGTLGASPTFVEIDCSGFKKLEAGFRLTFSEDLFAVEDEKGEIIKGKRLETEFLVKDLTDWNKLIINIPSLPSFQLKSLEGYSFKVDELVFDYSDASNAPSMRFPQNYEWSSGPQSLWRGLYIKTLSLKLPKDLSGGNVKGRKEIKASNVLIDEMGLSGVFEGTNLMTLEQGKVGSGSTTWDFSLDKLSITLVKNQLKGASMIGQVYVPISEKRENGLFDYEGSISGQRGNEYRFKVSNNPKDLSFSFFNTSKVNVTNLGIEIFGKNGSFDAKLDLSGSLSIKTTAPTGGEIDMNNITFQNLVVSTTKPTLSVKRVTVKNGVSASVAGMRLSITNINASVGTNKASVKFDADVDLGGAIKGGTTFEIIAAQKVDKARGSKVWRYDRTELSKIMLEANISGLEIYGELDLFENDKVYGSGIQGKGKINVSYIGFEVRTMLMFGRIKDISYWYADFLMDMGNLGEMAGLTGVSLRSIGGGAYGFMRMASGNSGSGSLGRTFTGLRYVPDREISLGFKATIGIAGPKNSYSANGTLEMVFNRGGGLSRIAIYGDGKIMETMPIPGLDAAKLTDDSFDLSDVGRDTKGALQKSKGSGSSSGGSGIYGSVFIELDFDNSILRGDFELNVDVVGGVIKGRGWATLYFSPGEWYVYIGKPSDRIYLSLLGLAQIDAYFMVGTKLEPSPPPPSKVSDILGNIDLDYMKHENEIRTGGGFAFGASFEVGGSYKFLIFYASFHAGGGFDIMIKDYGSDARCKGRSGAIGINGWYANGQAYAYFEGKMGIEVDLFFFKGRKEIFSIGAAVVLQAKLPNPVWMRGVIGGHYNIMGGLIKGRCSFSLTLGEECEIQKGKADPLKGVKILADVTPVNREEDVNVFNSPQAAFNMEVGTPFEIKSDGKVLSFTVELERFEIRQGGRVLSGSRKWNSDNTVVSFETDDILPPNTELQLYVEIKVPGGGKGGKDYIEKETVKFKTGDAPDYIPESNVRYAYPLLRQMNLYKNQSSGGYITLKKGMPHLFEEKSKYKFVARYTSFSEKVIEVPFNATSNNMTFTIPSELINEEVYFLQFVKIPKAERVAVDANLKEGSKAIEGQDAEVRTRSLEGSLTVEEETEVFSMNFRVSKYNTFAQKIGTYINYDFAGFTYTDNIRCPILAVGGDEPFEAAELFDNGTEPTLIQLTALFDNNNEWLKYIRNLVYTEYPMNGVIKVKEQNRSTAYGVPPVGAMFAYQSVFISNYHLSSDAINTGSVTYDNNIFYLQNAVPFISYKDYRDFRSQIAAYSEFKRSPSMNRLLVEKFTNIKKSGQNYRFELKYTLPGKRTPSYRKVYNMIY